MKSAIDFFKEKILLCEEKIKDDEDYIKAIELRIDLRKIELAGIEECLREQEKLQ